MLFGLDVGRKKVGLARSDDEERFVFPIGSYDRAQNRALSEILALIADSQPRGLVVGTPLDASGNPTAQSADIEQFCLRLSKRCSLPLFFIDESYSTEDVIELLGLKSEEKYRQAKQDGQIDAAAAAVILQRYLNRKA